MVHGARQLDRRTVMALDLSSATRQYASRPPDERFKDWGTFSQYLATRKTDSRVYSGAVNRLRVSEHDEHGLALNLGEKAQLPMTHFRSEERRVGKGCRSRWSA